MSTTATSKVFDYYNNSDTHNWYKLLWGEGNIHFGYFGPNIDAIVQNIRSDESVLSNISYPKAAEHATLRLSNIGGINSNSIVLDLGCGLGRSASKISASTNAKLMVGLDLSSLHIEKAKEMAQNVGKQNKLKFVCGSFLDFPSDILCETYSHIWSEAALSHCHPSLDVIIKQCKRVIHPMHGKLVINDCIANRAPNAETRKYVYDRMKYESLVSTKQYMQVLKQNGFKILYFEEVSKHLWLSYKILAYNAKKYGNRFDELRIKYLKSCESIERDEFR